MFGIAQWFACDKCWNRSLYTEHTLALEKSLASEKKKTNPKQKKQKTAPQKKSQNFNFLLDFLLFFTK